VRSGIASLKTAAVAAAVLATLAGVCFTVQAAALGRPPFATLELVHTLQQLRTPQAKAIAVEVVGFGPKCAIVAPVARAACKKKLAGWISKELVRGAAVKARTAELGALDGYALRLPWAKPHVELFVGRSGHPLLAVALHPEEAVR
jgi:hypothetical protein